MLNKKAQAQIITTVLIILLVLAAVVIVWQVISGTITEGGEQITAQSSCIGVSMDVTDATVGALGVGDTTVRRGQGSTDTVVTGYKLFIGGKLDATTTINLDPLSTDTQVTTLYAIDSGDKISAAAIVGTTVCAASAEYEVG